MDAPTLRSPVRGMTSVLPSHVRGGRISSLACEERVRSVPLLLGEG